MTINHLWRGRVDELNLKRGELHKIDTLEQKIHEELKSIREKSEVMQNDLEKIR